MLPDSRRRSVRAGVEVGDCLWRHRPAWTSARAAVVLLDDQSPVPAKNRVRCDDAGHLCQDPPFKFLAAHGESPALGIGQAKRSRAQLLPEDQILLPEDSRPGLPGGGSPSLRR